MIDTGGGCPAFARYRRSHSDPPAILESGTNLSLVIALRSTQGRP